MSIQSFYVLPGRAGEVTTISTSAVRVVSGDGALLYSVLTAPPSTVRSYRF